MFFMILARGSYAHLSSDIDQIPFEHFTREKASPLIFGASTPLVKLTLSGSRNDFDCCPQIIDSLSMS